MANETLEIYKEARKAGMQAAGFMFGCMLIISVLFGIYIYKSCETIPSTSTISQTQDGENNHQELTNGETNSNS